MDTVTQSFNDMSMAPELLNKYSDHAKAILPEFLRSQSTHQSQSTQQMPQSQSQSYDQMSTKPKSIPNIQDLSPEEQMHLMQRIQNNEFQDINDFHYSDANGNMNANNNQDNISERTYNPTIAPSREEMFETEPKTIKANYKNKEQKTPMQAEIFDNNVLSSPFLYKTKMYKFISKLKLLGIIFIIVFLLSVTNIVKLISTKLHIKNSIIVSALTSLLISVIIVIIVQILDLIFGFNNLY